SSTLLNLTEWENNEICLSFSDVNQNESFYKLSFDNGLTWSVNPFDFPGIAGYQIKNLSINSIGDDTLFAVFERDASEFSGVCARVSTDYGLNWLGVSFIADEIFHEQMPDVSILKNGNIVVAYVRDNVSVSTDYGDNDVYFITSTNNGYSWLPENKFTKYVGEDININLSSYQNKTFITFATERFSPSMPFDISFQVLYGILNESADKYTPPKVYETYAPPELIDFDKKEFVYQAKIVDDEAVHKVIGIMEDSIYTGEMFDDGLHNDGEANDSIFGNVFPFALTSLLNQYSFDVNKINLPMNNSGILADVNVSYEQASAILVFDDKNSKSVYESDFQFGGTGSQGMYEEGLFLFSAGFFLSGYTNGSLWSNAAATASLVQDYLPGTVNSNPVDPLFNIYIINKNDIPFGSTWQIWKDAVMLGAEFYDGDDDGNYNPVDKNYNGTWDSNEDMPLLLGDLTAWCVYNDGLPAEQRRWLSEPQGIEIRQTLFAIDQPELENVIFLKYSILNTGSVAEVMDSVFFAAWEDADLGDYNDDVVGCDTILNAGYFYNNDSDYVYGDNCPSFFTSLLQGPIINTGDPTDTAKNNLGYLIGSDLFTGAKNLEMTTSTFMLNSTPALGEPNSVIQARHYLIGKERFGEYPDPCTFQFCEVRGGINCNEINPTFWASGDPVTNVGWIDIMNRDHRNLVSTGPFTLGKNKPQDIIFAYVIGRGTDHFNSITVARENVQRAILEYENNFSSMTYSPPAPTNPVTSYFLFQNYPNPFNPTTTIRYELTQDGVVALELFDILGQKVKTLVNEFQQADRYEVQFDATGIASGVYIYQMRVNEFITSKKMVLIR
ncbi:MAG: T9SS type A sorting domain-containing protein, partial [Ignavibacteriales bacterium]